MILRRSYFTLSAIVQELDEEESKLLMNCGNHNFLRRSQTEHNVLSKYSKLHNFPPINLFINVAGLI